VNNQEKRLNFGRETEENKIRQLFSQGHWNQFGFPRHQWNLETKHSVATNSVKVENCYQSKVNIGEHQQRLALFSEESEDAGTSYLFQGNQVSFFQP
jgi:hypothetical protein